MALITLWIGFLEWGSKRPPCVHTYSTRVGLQAPPYVRMPASCVLYVPEAQGSSLCVRRARTSLGRAVRTAHRGTPGASSATSPRASCATPAAASAPRCADTYVPGPPYGTHQRPGASGIRHRAAARGGHCCTSGYTSGSCRTYAHRVAHCRLNPSSNPNPDPDPQASCSSTPPSPSAATLCGPSPPPRSRSPGTYCRSNPNPNPNPNPSFEPEPKPETQP
eukprot:scaffold75669_cov51-Phaeocystis_antarctica.AAC.1